MKKLIAGNWKMNGTLARARALAEAVHGAVSKTPSLTEKCDFLLCPPAVHVYVVKHVIEHYRSPIRIGGQDCASQAEGAFTGDIAPGMFKELGCSHVILGHSERRQHHGETDTVVAQKAVAAHKAGLTAIICVGETEGQRMAGDHEKVVGAQLAAAIPPGASAENTVIAYEPVWAIGTGKTATPADIAAMHGFIRAKLQEKLADSGKMRILYGGSVKPGNAGEIFAVANVNGALIGGASLNADDYIAIAAAA